MTEEQRWRWWTRSAGAVTVLVAVGIAVAAVRRSTTLLTLTVGLLVVALVTMVAVKSRPGALVPPALQALDAEQRRLVAEAVKAGGRRPTPPWRQRWRPWPAGSRPQWSC